MPIKPSAIADFIFIPAKGFFQSNLGKKAVKAAAESVKNT